MAFIGENYTPQVYENFSVRNMSRWEVFHELNKVMLAFGMKRVYPWGGESLRDKPLELISDGDVWGPIADDMEGSWAIYDFPGDFEFVNEGSSADGFFPYGSANDPDPIGGRTWRPCVVLWIAQQRSASNSNAVGTWFGVELINRRVGDLAKLIELRDIDINGGSGYISAGGGAYGAHMRTRTQEYSTISNQWQGTPTESMSTVYGTSSARGLGYLCALSSGTFPLFTQNSTYTSSSSGLIPVRSFRVILSKGGLLIQVGSGTRKSDNNDVLDVLVAFGGRRIPGRGRPAAEDIDRDHTNQAYLLTFTDTGIASHEFHDTSALGYAPRGFMAGARFTDPDPTLGVSLWSGGVGIRTFNFDNIDRVPYATLWFVSATRLSPRNIGGSGYHVLSRWVYATHSAMANGNVIMGTRDLAYSTVDPYYRWYEIYYCPHLVWADPVAPGGYFTDPASGIEYFFWRCRNTGVIAGIEVEGRGVTITPATLDAGLPSHTLIDETSYTVSGGAIDIAGGSVGSVPVTEISRSTGWNINAGADEVRYAAWVTQTTVDGWKLEFDVSGDPEGYGYELVAELENKSASALTGPGNTPYPDSNNLLYGTLEELSTGGEKVACVSGGVRNSGGDPAERGNSFADSSFWCHRTRDTKTIRFSFSIDYDSGSQTKEVAMRNLRLRRYQLAGGVA